MARYYKSIFTITPVDGMARDATISTATALTIPSDASGVMLQADTADVRFTIDGTTPTSTLGLILSSTAAPLRIDLYPGAVVTVISATGAINYQFFRTEDVNGTF